MWVLVAVMMDGGGYASFDMCYQSGRGGVLGDGRNWSVWSNDLVGPGEKSNRCTSVASVIPEPSDALSQVVSDIFDVVERATAVVKTKEILVLILIAVAEMDVLV